MDTEQERQHPTLHLFTLRLWEEALGEGKAEWRGRIQELSSGETVFFRDWPGLVATLNRLLAGQGGSAATKPPNIEHPESSGVVKRSANSVD